VKSRKIRANTLLFSVLLLVGGVLTFSAMLAPEQSRIPTHTISMSKTMSFSFVLSSGDPSYTVSLDNSTDLVGILSLESNDTPVQIVACGASGVFFRVSNLSRFEDVVIELYWREYQSDPPRYVHAPWNITFNRQTGDASVSVSMLLSYTGIVVSWEFLTWVLQIGLGLVALGVSVYGLFALKRRWKQDARGAGFRSRIASVVALMLLSSFFFVPLIIVGVVFKGNVGMDAQWIGNSYEMKTELNASHPEEQMDIYPVGAQPAYVHPYNISGETVLMSFETESAIGEFAIEPTQHVGSSWWIKLQKPTTLTFTAVTDNVTLELWVMSGYWSFGGGPNWAVLLMLGLFAAVGLIPLACGLDVARRIDTQRAL